MGGETFFRGLSAAAMLYIDSILADSGVNTHITASNLLFTKLKPPDVFWGISHHMSPWVRLKKDGSNYTG